MLRNIAGIMADEEPKTPVSSSGDYNTSRITTNGGVRYLSNSSSLLSSVSEFTIMYWVRISEFITNGVITPFTTDKVATGNSWEGWIRIDDDKIKCYFTNSQQQTYEAIYTVTTPTDEWLHVAMTGSVTNNEMILFVNGVNVASNTMPYPTQLLYDSAIRNPSDGSNVDMAQLNIYNRGLTELELAEHYVYDDDTMSSGVLGWDAMTPAQRSGLIYSSSFTKDISISGNEFNDKSGSGTTISPQPSLTGDQIYIYTDASDLPSDTQIHNVNSATFDGSGDTYYTLNNRIASGSTTVFSFSCLFYNDNTTYLKYLYAQTSSNGMANVAIRTSGNRLNYFARGNGNNSLGQQYSDTSSNNLILDAWNEVTVTHNVVTGVVEFTINDVKSTTSATMSSSFSDSQGIYPPAYGALVTGSSSDAINDSMSRVVMSNTDILSDSDIATLYEKGGEGSYKCLEDLPTSITDKFTTGHRCGEYNGKSATEDLFGSNDLTEVFNSPAIEFSYVDKGLKMECTS